jgi:hypothetical protein
MTIVNILTKWSVWWMDAGISTVPTVQTFFNVSALDAKVVNQA